MQEIKHIDTYEDDFDEIIGKENKYSSCSKCKYANTCYGLECPSQRMRDRGALREHIKDLMTWEEEEC